MDTILIEQVIYLNPGQDRPTLQDRLAGYCEAGLLACLLILAALLPYSDITALREIAIYLGLFLWLARMALSGRWEFKRTPLDIPLILLLATGLISWYTAVDPRYTLRELEGEMLKGIITYYLAVNNLNTELRAKAVWIALVVGALFMDAYGISWYFANEGSLAGLTIRVTSFHNSAPELWTYLVQSAPFLMAACYYLHNRKYKKYMVIAVLLHALTLYITYSRTASMTLVLESSCLFFFVGYDWKKILVYTITALLIILFFFPKPALVTTGPGVGDFTIPGLKGSRLLLWETAGRYLLENPFKGLGFGRRSFLKKFPG